MTFLFGLAATIAWVVVWDMRDHNSYSIIAAGGATVFYTIALGEYLSDHQGELHLLHRNAKLMWKDILIVIKTAKALEDPGGAEDERSL